MRKERRLRLKDRKPQSGNDSQCKQQQSYRINCSLSDPYSSTCGHKSRGRSIQQFDRRYCINYRLDTILDATLIVESTILIVMWYKSTFMYNTRVRPYNRVLEHKLRYFVVCFSFGKFVINGWKRNNFRVVGKIQQILL